MSLSSFTVVVDSVDYPPGFDSLVVSIGDEESDEMSVGQSFTFTDVDGESTIKIVLLDEESEEIDSADVNLVAGTATGDFSSGGSITVTIKDSDSGAEEGFNVISDEDAPDVFEESAAPSKAAPPKASNPSDSDHSSDEDSDHGEDPFMSGPSGSGTAYHTDSESSDEEEEEEENMEPTPLMLWEEKHMEELQEKAASERREREEIKQRAKEWMTKFYEDRTVRVHNQEEQNQLHQNQLQDSIAFNLGQGSVWERTTNLVDMKSSRSKKGDLARMRSILLQVKNHTPEHLARHDGPGGVSGGSGGASSSSSSSKQGGGGGKGGDWF